MKLRPFQGKVLIRMDPQEAQSYGGVLLPEEAQQKSQTGTVLRLGIWRQFKNGNLRPFPVKRGQKVVVNRRRGRWIHGEHSRLKLVDQEDLLAVVTNGE